ncbi:MAG: hypothetical protein PVH88_23115 [Ignavibacteria bacterium]|jgi:tetratricopeptide (TPR) repeat protein
MIVISPLWGSIFVMFNIDPLFIILFLIVLIALIIFYFVKKSFSNRYDDRIVDDLYNDIDAYSNEVERLIGSSYAKQYSKNLKGAVEDLTNAIKLDPSSEQIYLMRAKLFIELTEYEKSKIDLNKAIMINPEYETAYYYRAKAKSALGDAHEASLDIEKAELLGGFTYKEDGKV